LLKGGFFIQITIDGPAGAGKSTVAKAVANKLNYIYIDTGAMYRAVALLALEQGIDLDDEAALSALAKSCRIHFRRSRYGQKVFCNDKDVTKDIREPSVSRIVSKVSAVSGVREAMVEAQQKMAQGQNVVMDGRDAGTVVLPHADCKIFLTASVEERAKRRLKQQQRLGLEQDLQAVIKDMTERDYQDTHRNISPLKPAEDAVILDCTNLDLAQTIDEVLAVIDKAAKRKRKGNN